MAGPYWRALLLAVAVNLSVSAVQAHFDPPPVESGPAEPRLLPGLPGEASGVPGFAKRVSYVQPVSDTGGMLPDAAGNLVPANAAQGNVAPAGPGSASSGNASLSGPCESGTCDSGMCGGCRDCHCCGDPCEFPCGWYVGAEALWARPYFQHNTAYLRETSSLPTSVNNNTYFNNSATEAAFHHDFEITPRIWVGYETECGLGVRARFWEFDQQSDEISLIGPDANVSVIVLPINLSGLGGNSPNGGFIVSQTGDAITIQSSLEMHVLDLEATQRLKWCCTEAQVGLGIRIVRIQQSYDAELSRVNSMDDDDYLRHSTKFEGAGPTLALDLRRPICCCGGWSVFGGARGAVLFGKTNESFCYEVQVDSTTFSGGHVERSEYEARAVGEFQLGLEWKHCLECGAELFAQGSIEGQVWEGIGSSLDSGSDIGMLGFGIAVGVHR